MNGPHITTQKKTISHLQKPAKLQTSNSVFPCLPSGTVLSLATFIQCSSILGLQKKGQKWESNKFKVVTTVQK